MSLISGARGRIFAWIQRIARFFLSSSGDRSDVTYARFGDELTGDLVVLAVPHSAYPNILEHYRERLSSKVVIDISNPIDFSRMRLR